jgi:hypothetical protein
MSFIVPSDARELAFTLVAYGKGGIDDRSLVIPLVVQPRQAPAPKITADAGDDQIAVVGRQVTLNGIRSQPSEKLKYRWTQVDGPKLRSKYEQDSCCTFTPEQPGVYRFLLVVANHEEISQASEVKVLVSASTPAELEGHVAPVSKATRSTISSDPAEALARETLRGMGEESRIGDDLGAAFEGVADRMDLYTSYDEVFSEISRRIDSVLSDAGGSRTDLIQTVFTPLSAQILRNLRAEGLDLARANAARKPLSMGQKARLASTYRAIARGFKAAGGRLAETTPARTAR